MRSYVKNSLMPGEQIVYSATLHWNIYVSGLMIVLAGGVFGHYAAPLMTFLLGDDFGKHLVKMASVIGLAVIGFGSLLLLFAFIRQSATEIVITNKRVIAKYGIFSRNTFEIMNARVTGMNFDQTIMGRLFGFGRIVVHGAGADSAYINDIAHPQRFHSALMQVVERVREPWGEGGGGPGRT